MTRFRLMLVLLLAAGGCSRHSDLSNDSSERDAGDEPDHPAGKGAAGRGTGGTGGGIPVGDGGMQDSERDASADGAVDACADLPNACSEAGATCTGNTLVTCAMNADGCLVTTRTNCTRGGTNFCDSARSPAACAVDPCAGLAGRCATEGQSCSGTALVTCAKNEDGCLVATREECTQQDGKNACGGDPVECRYDPCRDAAGKPKSDICATPQDSCAGDYWVHCVPDDDGCAIATRTDCTREPNANMCDAEADPPACGFDPCKDVSNCLVAGKTCDGVKLIDCAPNADGCLVKSTTDCTQGQTQPLTCDASSGTPVCTTCNDAAGCADRAEGDTLCDGNVFQKCSDTDGDTCLNAVREDCGASFSCDPVERCVFSGDEDCTSEITASLSAAMSYGPFDTTGAGNDYSGYSCTGLFFGVQATSPDLLFAVDVAPKSVVSVALSSPEGFAPQLLLLTRCADDPTNMASSAEASCRSASNTDVVYTNETDTRQRIYVVVDADRTNNMDSAGTFGLTVDSRPYVCGDGKRDGAEACDDGNIASGDGCTPTCARETGFNCTSSNPSICTRRPTDGICANVRCPDLPSDAPANSQTCCTPDQRCGIAYSLFFGAGCLARDQPGVDGGGCPDEPSVFPTFIPALEGCCRPDNTCGLAVATGAGCVERTAAWAAMADGFGDFLYRGPFAAVGCGGE
jgi:cysteine-rich repeat protein